MNNKNDILDKSMKIIKDNTDNEELKRIIELLENTPSNEKTLSNEKIKILSHYTYKDYSKKGNTIKNNK